MALDYSRPKRDRPIGRRILIVCEGQTEASYFHDLRQSLRLQPNKIIVNNPRVTDPLSIVKAACEECEMRRQDRTWAENTAGQGDIAWAVFDGDEHILHDRKGWMESIDLARRKKISLAISNPCFEYWYLLHFQDQTANLRRDEASKLLKQHLPRYEKSDRHYEAALKAKTSEAIQRAKSVTALAERNGVEKYENPCARVWELVELILSLSSEQR